MRLVEDLWKVTNEVTLTYARASQAVVIEIADRAAHVPLPGFKARSALIGTGVRAISRRLGEQGSLTDRPYDLMTSLVALHREFAHRLMDVVIDLLEVEAHERAIEQGDVISLDAMRARRLVTR